MIGTLGKALGSYGAYACAARRVVRLMINTARSLIFSTAPGPPALAGALAALELLEREPQRVRAAARQRPPAARGARAARASRCRRGRCRSSRWWWARSATRWRSARRRSSAACSPRRSGRRRCRPGTARLRLAVMATHSPEELRYAARVLGECARELGLDPARMGPLHEERIATAEERRTRSTPAATARRALRLRPRCAPPSRPAARARPVRHRHRHGRRQERRQRLPAGRDARRGRAGARLQAGGHRPRGAPAPGRWPADHELLGPGGRDGPRGGRAAALRTGRRPRTWRPLWRACRSTRAG